MPESTPNDGGELVRVASVRQSAHSNPQYIADMEAAAASGICPVCPGGNIRSDSEKWEAFNLYENASWTVRQTPYPDPSAMFHFAIFLKRHANQSIQLSTQERADLFSAIDWLVCYPEEVAKKLHELKQQGLWKGSVDYQSPAGYVFFMRNGMPLSKTGAAMAHLHAQFIIPTDGKVVRPSFGQEKP